MSRRNAPGVGARFNPERDGAVCYTLARFGAATCQCLAPLFWGAAPTARHGFARLLKLGLIRTFPRSVPCAPAWYALTRAGYALVQKETDAPDDELRRITRLDRANLSMLSARNDLWVSLALAARREPRVRLVRFTTEAELRRQAANRERVVPDASVALSSADGSRLKTWFIELDSGHQRLATWQEKSAQLAACQGTVLYGAAAWQVLASVPSLKRARGVARAVMAGGAGHLVFLAVAAMLTGGQAFAPAVWRAQDLACGSASSVPTSLIEGLIDEADTEGGTPIYS